MYVRLFSGGNLHDLMFAGVCSHVTWRVFRLQMSGLTANQQFRSSVTRTENMYMFEVGFRILLSKLKVILTAFTCMFI